MRWNWRGRLRPGGADDLVRSLPNRKTRSRYGRCLRSDSGWERAWIRDRWIDRCAYRLALGVLSGRPAGLAAGSALLLATRPARRSGSAGTEITAPQSA